MTFRPLLITLTFLLAAVCLSPAYGTQGDEHEAMKAKIRAMQARGQGYEQDSTYIDLLTNLGSELRFYKPDSLNLLASEALSLSKKIDYKKGESYALIRLGDYYSDQGQSTKAVNYYSKALGIAEDLKNTPLALDIMNNLAGEFGYQGDYAKALSIYLEGIELAEKEGDKEILSIMNENVANLYNSQKDYQQALIFYKKVMKLNDEIGNELFSAMTMSNLASMYADMGELEYAMFHVNKSIAIFEKKKNKDWLAYAYETKGKVYLKEKNYKWALYWFNQSELLHDKIQDERGKITLFNSLAETYLAMDNDTLASSYASEAFVISNTINFMEGRKDCAKVLYEVHKKHGNYQQALQYHELFQQLSDTLSRNENQKILSMFKTKNDFEQQKLALMAANEEALARQQNYINIALCILFIFIIVTFIVHRGQKMQKRLNSKLQAKQDDLRKREKELKANNQMKNKLFSIIGHDLRGPIGALQGLLNMLEEGEIEKDDFWEFFPKLRSDVDHILFTLNNLLTWGHTQMNGAVTIPSVTAMENIVDDNINLLTEVAKKKSINIINDLPDNTLVWADPNQVDIVVRNLISNALKFTPENGMIFVNADESATQWEISVRDTGVGMDQITKDKLFNSNDTITTYGTNNEKGTGLGLSLCKEMVEKNDGEIWVESALRKGSCFYFTLPKKEKQYVRAS